ncbi:MAG: TVP38/TMEM64 family protein [Myxococcales bacterium]
MAHAIVQLADWIRGAGAAGVGAYAVIYVLATLFFLPGSLVTLAAGFAYGPLWGTLLVSPVSVLAAILAFLLGRSAARGWIARRMERQPRFAAMDRAVGERGFLLVLLLRLSPVVPFNLLNYALGLTRVRLRDYAVASFVGMLPGTVLYVYLGSLVTSASELLSGAPVKGGLFGRLLYWGGLAATVAVTVWLTQVANDAIRRALSGQPPAEGRP